MLIGCASRKSPPVAPMSSQPGWLDNLEAHCKKSQLCAVGSGESRSMAKVSATAELAKIFETQVKVEFQSELKDDNGVLSSKTSENIKQVTDLALEGVSHPQIFEGPELYHALAVIHRRKGARQFEKEMKRLDAEMKALGADPKTGTWFFIESLIKQREVFHKRYSFLTGFDKPGPYSYAEVLKKKRAASRGIVVHLMIDEKSPKRVQPYLADLLSESGFAVTKGKNWNAKSTHLLSGKLRYEKSHLKVKGFQKYQFVLTLESQNRQKVQSSNFNITVKTIGRSFEQNYQNAIEQFKDKILKKFGKISFKK
jgi:hypothetical protein